MRIALVRTDLDNLYLSDVEPRSQRCFSSSPPGQSRYIRRPADAILLSILNTYGVLSLRGSDVAADVDTSVNDTLEIRTSATAAYTVIAVTADLATPKTTIRDDLNAGFIANNLQLVASIVGTNQLQIDTVAPNSGPAGKLQIDTIVGGCTLSTPLGFTDGANLTGLSLAAFKAAIYPTPITIDISMATIGGLSTYSYLSNLGSFTYFIQEAVAPHLVETGRVLLSFANGMLGKSVSATFQPGGARIGLPAGPAFAIVEDDGVTPFTI